MADKKKADNQSVEHTFGGATTRDALDLGVPMLAGDPSEPVGPEDALGPGPKRGDYSKRLGSDNYAPHTSEPIPDNEREEGGPHTRLVAQRSLVENVGDEKGKKGGVQTV